MSVAQHEEIESAIAVSGVQSTDAAILLSGGMDSIALAYWLRPIRAYTVDYGQLSAEGEVRAAAEVARALGITHDVLTVDCRALGSGDLAGRPPLDVAPVREWWPFRNQLLVTLAGMRAVGHGVRRLLLGAVATDSAHSDGRSDFVSALDAVLALQEGTLRLEAPAIHLTTAELVRQAGVPRSLLAWAHSCHTGAVACGSCRGCQKHLNVTETLWGTAQAY